MSKYINQLIKSREEDKHLTPEDRQILKFAKAMKLAEVALRATTEALREANSVWGDLVYAKAVKQGDEALAAFDALGKEG